MSGRVGRLVADGLRTTWEENVKGREGRQGGSGASAEAGKRNIDVDQRMHTCLPRQSEM